MPDHQTSEVPLLVGSGARCGAVRLGRPSPLKIGGLRIAARVVTALGRCLGEARPVVQVIFLMRFAAGAALGAGRLQVAAAALGALGWFLATCAIYLYNGVADYPEDVGNGSRRPIASGALPLPFARRVVFALAFAALIQAIIAGPRQFAIMVTYLAVGYTYSGPPFPLKRRYYAASLGGAALGLLTYFGGAAAALREISAPLLVFALAMTVWMGGVGGIAKDLPDVAGDRLAGRRTWPVVLGQERAGGLMSLVAFAVAVAFTVAAAVVGHGLLLPAAVVAAGAAVLTAVSARVPRDASRRVRRRPYRVFMTVQYLAHAGLVTALLAPLPVLC